ncbi:MAG: NAD(P)/FAD-dependent oxidoreductase [Labilithrix sp.]|nr:NAD(P)/FAD-dependent oxidoreductase [Labilithrix sp.]MCW5812417.1 NAD(P)/FAD-dependent oxidoreductase [Labilithrix sp.]
MQQPDVLIVGGGLNGLACALFLCRSGLTVQVLDDKQIVGGIHRTEFPFAKAPRLPTFTGAHRVGFVPGALAAQLGVTLPLAPRDPALFVPTTTPGRYLLAGPGAAGLRAADPSDADALDAMHAELDALVSDLATAWIAAPVSIEEIRERWIRPELRDAFTGLVRGTFAEYVARFNVQSGLVKAALAADSLGGSFASWDTPGSGASLLVRHAAASPAGGGDAIPLGGMAAVARALGDAGKAAGVRFATGTAVTQILVEGNAATGVVLEDGRILRANAVVTSADPWRLRALVGPSHLSAEYTRRIDAWVRPGGIAKLLVAFAELPRFACLPEENGQHRATTLLLPGGEDDAVRALGRAFADANAGRIPIETPIELVFPNAADPSIRDPDGRESASLLVPWVPYDVAGSTWTSEEERFTSALLDTLESFAPGARASVVDTVLLHPKKLETHFGVTRGHLHHVDDTALFGDRLPPTTPLSGLYTCGRGCGPAAGVVGVAGLNAARRVIADLELALERTEVGIHE